MYLDYTMNDYRDDQDIQEEMEKREIRNRAYALWERAGKPDGRSLDFWLKAEYSYKIEMYYAGIQESNDCCVHSYYD